MTSIYEQNAPPARFATDLRLHDVSWAFAPAPEPEPREKPNWFLLGIFALAHFALIFAFVTGLWLVALTGGVSASDFSAVAHELADAAGWAR